MPPRYLEPVAPMLVLLLGSLTEIACSAAPSPPSVSTAPTLAAPTPAAVPRGDGGSPPSRYRLPASIPSWRSWIPVGAGPVPSPSHRLVSAQLRTTSPSGAAALGSSTPIEVGTAWVLAPAAESEASRALFVMIKMKPGFDPARGDWYYGVYGVDGRMAIREGKSDGDTALCSACHETSAHDHLFQLGRASDLPPDPATD